MQPARSRSGMNAPGTGAPNVYIEARYRPHPHSSIELTKFGLPNARRRRTIQSTESLIADVDGEADPNTTDSGPDAAAIAVNRAATVSSASSQPIRSHPGSSAPSAPYAAAGAAPDRRGPRSPAPPCPSRTTPARSGAPG